MALSKVNFNSLNLTPTASKTVVFNSNNNGIEAGDVGGALTLISTQTASSSSTKSFTSGIDSTYKEYIFKFIDIHPATDDARLTFQADTGTNTNYNITTTNSSFRAYHTEADDGASLDYQTGNDLAQGTGFQHLFSYINTDADMSCAGTLHLFNPSSTTFVKNFLFRGISPYPSSDSDGMKDQLVAGYANTTSAVNAIQFKMLSGNIDSGTIKLYGVS